jgi:hypothetical protein
VDSLINDEEILEMKRNLMEIQKSMPLELDLRRLESIRMK